LMILVVFCCLTNMTLSLLKRKRKVKSRDNPVTYKTLNDGYLPICVNCAIDNNHEDPAEIFNCPHALEKCKRCIPKLHFPKDEPCQGCFAVIGIGACMQNMALNDYIYPVKKVDPKDKTIEDDPFVEKPVFTNKKKPDPKPKVVDPIIEKMDDIVEATGKSNLFMVLDCTISMDSKKVKLLAEINKLRGEGKKITYCYKNTYDPMVMATLTRDMVGNDLLNRSGTVFYEECLKEFNDSEEPYDLLYIIGDGDFDKRIKDVKALDDLIIRKAEVEKKATLIQSGDATNTEWTTVVAAAGFALNILPAI